MANPHRAVILTAQIEADTRNDMVQHLLNLAHQVERDDIGSTSISGGVHSGHILQFSDNGQPSHDAYFDELRTYLDSLKAAKEQQA